MFLPHLQRRETWEEQVDRVLEMHRVKYQGIDLDEELTEIRKAMINQEVLGSQRALQFGGPGILQKEARIYNCCATPIDRPRVFQEAFWLLLCGCGTGFGMQEYQVAQLPSIHVPSEQEALFTVPDNIEGWADAAGVLLSSYFVDQQPFPHYHNKKVYFDYSLIRDKGSLIKSSGRAAPGPSPLRRALESIRKFLDHLLGKEQITKMRPIHAYDILMFISDSVASGGCRRAASSVIFSPTDQEMIEAKTGDWFIKNPQRGRSNNSVLLLRDRTSYEDFAHIIARTKQYGEPGFVWAQHEDTLFNPCYEIGLYGYTEKTHESGWGMCNLSVINVKKAPDRESFLQACRTAALLGTIQAGYTNFTYLTEATKEIVEREALLGVSMTGMMDCPFIFDPELQRTGAQVVIDTNIELAHKLALRPAARVSTVKPEGCLRGDTMIPTVRGLLKLKEIGEPEGDRWQEIDLALPLPGSRVKTASKFFVNGTAKTKRIVMSSGVEIEATLQHKFRVFEDGKLVWKKMEEIVGGEVLPYIVGAARTLCVTEEIPLEIVPPPVGSRKVIKRYPKTLNREVAWFLGIYVGDGSNHQKSIRIHGNKDDISGLKQAKDIIEKQFGITSTIWGHHDNTKRICLNIFSTHFMRWMEHHCFLKAHSHDISMLEKIRRSPPAVMEAYLDGYWAADGSYHQSGGLVTSIRTWCTTSVVMAQEMVQMLRYLGYDATMREMPPTATSYGTNMRYWIAERRGWDTPRASCTRVQGSAELLFKQFIACGLTDYTPDVVMEVHDSSCPTYDLEVPKRHQYIANSYCSHNSSSCLLGTASGIHPHHAHRYIRRVQITRDDHALQFFRQHNAAAIETSVWAPTTTDVISFTIQTTPEALTKKQVGSLELLDRVVLTQRNWVAAGKRDELCVQPFLTHNVSNTITVEPEQWDEVTRYIYEHREWLAGVSLISSSGDKDYHQAPFQAVCTPHEIVQEYGSPALFAAGLIVHAFNAFGDLYKACDTFLDRGESVVMPDLLGEEAISQAQKILEKKLWIERAKKFTHRYFSNIVNYEEEWSGEDIIGYTIPGPTLKEKRRMTYCLKDVDAWKRWCDLRRAYRRVPWEEFREESAGNARAKSILDACSGGKCELTQL